MELDDAPVPIIMKNSITALFKSLSSPVAPSIMGSPESIAVLSTDAVASAPIAPKPPSCVESSEESNAENAAEAAVPCVFDAVDETAD